MTNYVKNCCRISFTYMCKNTFHNTTLVRHVFYHGYHTFVFCSYQSGPKYDCQITSVHLEFIVQKYNNNDCKILWVIIIFLSNSLVDKVLPYSHFQTKLLCSDVWQGTGRFQSCGLVIHGSVFSNVTSVSLDSHVY